MEEAQLLQVLGQMYFVLQKERAAPAKYTKYTDYSPQLLQRCRRIRQSGVELFPVVRKLAEELLEKFDGLCSLLRADPLKPDVKANKEVAEQVMAFGEVWQHGQHICSQTAIDFIMYALAYLPGAFRSDSQAITGQDSIEYCPRGFRRLLKEALCGPADGRGMKEEALTAFYVTLPMLMYLDSLVKDSPEGAACTPRPGVSVFRELFTKDEEEDHQLFKKASDEIGKFEKYRMHYLIQFLQGWKVEEIAERQRQYFEATVSNQLRKATRLLGGERSDRAGAEALRELLVSQQGWKERAQWRSLFGVVYEVRPDIFA